MFIIAVGSIQYNAPIGLAVWTPVTRLKLSSNRQVITILLRILSRRSLSTNFNKNMSELLRYEHGGKWGRSSSPIARIVAENQLVV